MERLDYLIDYLLKESGRDNFDYSNRDKKSLYRALVNVRQANPISEEFLKVEDEYLQEEYWGAWVKHIDFANTGRKGTELYKKIFDLVKDKEYFVITTNVDDQFYKTGFDKDRIFRVQGSYALNQCRMGCHNKLYSNVELVNKMLKSLDNDLKVPTELVPICPVCGESMEPNLRKDGYFVQDDLWYKQNDKYEKFISDNSNKNVLLLEFGAGFNTPGIIRFPFEQMTSQNKKWKLIRFNKENMTFYDLENRFIGIDEDINKFFKT